MAGPTSVEQIVNQALNRIGWPEPVNNIYEGTRQARVAIDLYAQTRDELLRQSDWGFAERNVLLELLKQAPDSYVPGVTPWDPALYPPPPWLFEYAYPADCLKVRAVKPVPLLVINMDPQPYVWSTPNDNAYTPPRKVIVCNVPNAALVYTAQVLDPTTWESDFCEGVVAALARRMAPALANMQAAKFEAADESAAINIAEKEQG